MRAGWVATEEDDSEPASYPRLEIGGQDMSLARRRQGVTLLQPLDRDLAERHLMPIPRPDNQVDAAGGKTDLGAEERHRVCIPAALDFTRERPGLTTRRNGQEAVVPTVPPRSQTTRHPLGPSSSKAAMRLRASIPRF